MSDRPVGLPRSLGITTPSGPQAGLDERRQVGSLTHLLHAEAAIGMPPAPLAPGPRGAIAMEAVTRTVLPVHGPCVTAAITVGISDLADPVASYPRARSRDHEYPVVPKDVFTENQRRLYETFGLSPGAPIGHVGYVNGAERTLQEFFGRLPTSKEIHALAGVPFGAEVTVTNAPSAKGAAVKMYSASDTFRLQEVAIRKRSAGLELRLDWTIAMPDLQMSGVASMSLALQRNACETMGVSEITALAARHPGANGYYVFPRNGGNATFERDKDDTLEALWNALDHLPQSLDPDVERLRNAASTGSVSLRELMRTQTGRDLWRMHGATVEVKWSMRDPGLWDAMAYTRDNVPIMLLPARGVGDP